MFGLKRKGGETVGKGNYWNFDTGERVYMPVEGALPGGDGVTYYRVQPSVLILVAPLMGLVYAIFLPFIAIAALTSVVAAKLFGVTLWKGVSLKRQEDRVGK